MWIIRAQHECGYEKFKLDSPNVTLLTNKKFIFTARKFDVWRTAIFKRPNCESNESRRCVMTVRFYFIFVTKLFGQELFNFISKLFEKEHFNFISKLFEKEHVIFMTGHFHEEASSHRSISAKKHLHEHASLWKTSILFSCYCGSSSS